jgi:hypothetical protein
MSFVCASEDQVIQRPSGGLSFPAAPAQAHPPFTLKGAPLTNRPQPLQNISEQRRLPSANQDIKNPTAYFADDNYYILDNLTEHILVPDPNTTLRFEETNYSLMFICLHKGLWAENTLQTSAFFMSSDGKMFHMCFPITYQDSGEAENLFLKFWLYPTAANEALPPGFTMNELLSFTGTESDVRFATLQHCLKYNAGRVVKPYTFCIFQTPLRLNKKACPQWLQADPFFTDLRQPPTMSGGFRASRSAHKYRRKTFSEILNLMLKGTFNQYVTQYMDAHIVSTEEHFDSDRTQITVTPTYYKVTSQKLTGRSVQSFTSMSDRIRGLKNIKCYPIDLASQVDDEGNIFIDETTKQPIDISQVGIDKYAEADESLSIDNRTDQLKNESWLRFMISFVVIFFIVGALILTFIVFVFQGRDIGQPDLAPIAAAAAAAPAAAAGPGPSTS